MKNDLYSYMNLGINHHLLNFRCFEDHNYHLETLPFVLNHSSFQIVDLFVVDDDGIREKEIELIQNSEKGIVYNGAIMLPSTKYNPHSLVKAEREEIFQSLRKQADLAIEVGASKFVVVSNFDPGEEKRREAKEGFAAFLYDFASYISDKSEMKVVLEPGDRDIDKNFLLGPTKESVEVVEMARQKGCKNLGLMVDMSHLPLLGESFQHAVQSTEKLLWHVHLGSCILRDKAHPRYGDKHPPIGAEGGENGVVELAEFLKELMKVGYLNPEGKNSVTLEIRPLPDSNAEEMVANQLQLLNDAWKMI